jgi:hypothetical protein
MNVFRGSLIYCTKSFVSGDSKCLVLTKIQTFREAVLYAWNNNVVRLHCSRTYNFIFNPLKPNNNYMCQLLQEAVTPYFYGVCVILIVINDYFIKQR